MHERDRAGELDKADEQADQEFFPDDATATGFAVDSANNTEVHRPPGGG